MIKKSGSVRSNCGRYTNIPRLKPSFSAPPLNLRPTKPYQHHRQHTGDASYIYNNFNSTVDNTIDEMDSEEGGQRKDGEDR